SARKIAVYGYTTVSSFGKNWGGYAELNLNPGDEVDVQIDMLPIMKIDSINSRQVSNYLQIQWYQVQSGTYGITGYKIYRSDFPEGPYFTVGTASGASAYQFNDNSIIFDQNTYYYYKVSAYTGTTEGELSEYYGVFYLS
ncbi:MAG: fibronectin type III domain-containing protein, partial [Spirochaetes bacterium]|nr:fibronectin type III domain-containing protein [Spirochaetota bacterium]